MSVDGTGGVENHLEGGEERRSEPVGREEAELPVLQGPRVTWGATRSRYRCRFSLVCFGKKKPKKEIVFDIVGIYLYFCRGQSCWRALSECPRDRCNRSARREVGMERG